MDPLQVLTTRVSAIALGEPAPDEAALRRILEAAVRAPDHGRLQPWRFIKIAGPAALDAFGDLMAEAQRRRDPTTPEAGLAMTKQKALRAPMVLVVAAKLQDHPKIPVIEQTLAAAAAAQNVLLAAHALGYGAMWKTGAPAYDPFVKERLGLSERDAIVAFLYLGTPAQPLPPAKQNPVEPVTLEWTGSVN